MQHKGRKPNLVDHDSSSCSHKNLMRNRGYIVCKDCGLTLGEDISILKDNLPYSIELENRQRIYEGRIQKLDKAALQNPIVKQKYAKIKKLGKWYKDSKTSFARQKNEIDLIKGYNIRIDSHQFESIKRKYLSYLKNFKQPFQNMVLIFLAIIWDEIKDTTNIRIDRYIEICIELGHKINKKMLNNALIKVGTIKLKKKKEKDEVLKSIKIEKKKLKQELEQKLKEQIKFLFNREINKLQYEQVSKYVESKEGFENIKIQMQLLAYKVLKLIPYKMINSVNIKAFVSGFIYYIAQISPFKNIFTQKIIADEGVSDFSATTIRKQFNYIKGFLGEPTQIVL